MFKVTYFKPFHSVSIIGSEHVKCQQRKDLDEKDCLFWTKILDGVFGDFNTAYLHWK